MRKICTWWWLCLLGLACAAAPAWASKRVALLIGNQAYAHERALRNPVNDAELLGGVLRDELKFDLVRVERNLDLAGMDRVVEQFAQQARGATTVVFYFSGHGLTSPGDRRSFLLPVDARTGVPGAPPLRRQAVAADEVREALRAAGARVTLMLLDACRDGPGDGRSGSKGLARVGGGEQLLVAYATEEGQIAEDGSSRNSPYAEALATAWRQPLPILAQLDRVYDLVTARVPGQRPTREGNLRTDAFLGNPFAPVTPENRGAVEDAAWALCQNGATRVPCDDYLNGWPQGRYAALARTRIRDLLERERQQAQPQPQPQPQAQPQAQPVPAPVVAGRTPGEAFRDCAECPELVVVGAGSFVMGSPASEVGRQEDGREGPQRPVRIERAFALGRTEVTVGQWRRFVQATGHVTEAERNVGSQGCWAWEDSDGKWDWRAGRSWRDPGFAQDDSHPVVCVSWNDVQAYVQWLNRSTGQTYRLPSEAEWEYAARAGAQSSRPWGDDPNQACRWANVADQSRGPGGRTWNLRHECNDGFWFTAPVGTYGRSAFGLHDMIGNVWEWTQDCYEKDAYQGRAPSDGRAFEGAGCSARVARGGSGSGDPTRARSASRLRGTPASRDGITGFRLARMQPAPASPVAVPTPAAGAATTEKVSFAADVLFASRGSSLSQDFESRLRDLHAKIQGINAEVVIAVGHAATDEGSVADQQQISIRRAEAVKAVLTGLGVDRSRVYTEGKGASQPVADNATPEGRARNRRVEIEVVGTRTR